MVRSLFFLIVTIALFAVSEKASNKAVWGTFINSSGWPNNGVSFALGLLTPAFALAGSDGIVHMAEESHSPKRDIPRAMIWSVVINGVSGFVYVIAVLYSINDTEAVLKNPTPIIIVFYQATRLNQRAATAMACSVSIVLAMSFFGIVASTSRLTWALARDK
jgi:choline transport protein